MALKLVIEDDATLDEVLDKLAEKIARYLIAHRPKIKAPELPGGNK